MSKANKQQVPKIRFEGFSENWEQKKLGQLVFSLDAGVSVNSVDNEVSNYWILKTSCITGGIFNENERKAVVDQNEIIRLKEPLLSNSILMSRMNTPTLVGVTGYVEEATHNTFLPDRLWQFKLKENKVDVCWLSNLFLTEKNLQIRQSNATGTSGSMKNISKASVLQEEIFLTSLIEQTQIGNFFQQLDKLIELQTRAVESAEKYKKAMLQKMFPQKGEKVPRVRFEGFGEAWQSYNLDSLVKINMGQSPDSVNYTENSEDHILVQGNADLDKGKVVPRVYTTQVTKTAEKGDIILTVRAPVGAIAITDFDVVLGRGVAGIKGNLFVYYTLELFCLAGTWLRFSSGSTFDSINSNEIKQIVVLVPSKEEQEKIGSFFQKLDQKIESEKKKLEQYQTMKRALLQRMFV